MSVDPYVMKGIIETLQQRIKLLEDTISIILNHTHDVPFKEIANFYNELAEIKKED